MKIIKATAIFLLTLILAPEISGSSTDRKYFAVKASANIGLASNISFTSPFDFSTNNLDGNSYSVDFGYSFWNKPNMNLEANIGLGYQNLNTSLSLPKLDFNYDAGPDADEDGNRYVRYYELSDINQQINISYITLPVYFTYNYILGSHFTIHADFGFQFGFKNSSSLEKAVAQSYCYGIFPQYDNLKIDADWLNNFGKSEIDNKNMQRPAANSLHTSLMLGVGAEIRIFGPVSLDLGIRYLTSVTDVFTDISDQSGTFTPETAPVSYTVKNGERVNALTNYASKSKSNNLGFKAGIVIRF